MNNDFGQLRYRRPNSDPNKDNQSLADEDENKVDEQKIEQEFGPPPDEAEASKSRASKMLLLLPSFRGRNLKNVKIKKIIAAVVIGLLLIAGITSFGILHFYKPAVVPASILKKAVPIKPTTVASTLSGLQVAPSVNQRPVTAVMIENSDAARPQSGLDQASVVFEALAEGGITRFLALYQDTQPNYLGPVRSVRPYYLQWALGFDAAVAHVGGSPEALADITTFGVKNLDEFYNGGSYERISSRQAPHNVYTSIAQLNQLETSKGFTSSTYTGFSRKTAAPSQKPTVTNVNMSFSSSDFAVNYTYNAKTNNYSRSEGGAPHMELNADGSQVQITPTVVIAMIVPYSQGALDSSGAYYSVYDTLSSGPVYIFQDGVVETGIWTKTSNAAQITFTNTAGQTIGLDPGQTWIEALSSTQDLTYN